MCKTPSSSSGLYKCACTHNSTKSTILEGTPHRPILWTLQPSGRLPTQPTVYHHSPLNSQTQWLNQTLENYPTAKHCVCPLNRPSKRGGLWSTSATRSQIPNTMPEPDSRGDTPTPNTAVCLLNRPSNRPTGGLLGLWSTPPPPPPPFQCNTTALDVKIPTHET